jgi:hypothetical protein
MVASKNKEVLEMIQIPLLKTCQYGELDVYYLNCKRKGIPYAAFIPRKEYGRYFLDLQTADYDLDREALRDAIEAIIKDRLQTWEKKGYRSYPASFSCGLYNWLSKCPAAEVDEFHQAICIAVNAARDLYTPTNKDTPHAHLP